MKPTELTDEQINHLCAVARGWSLDTSERRLYIGGHFDRIRTLLWVDSKGECICRKDAHDPLHNKSQAMDLLIEFLIEKEVYPLSNGGIYSIYQGIRYDDLGAIEYRFSSLEFGDLKCICLAVIASVWGDDVPDELLEKADE